MAKIKCNINARKLNPEKWIDLKLADVSQIPFLYYAKYLGATVPTTENTFYNTTLYKPLIVKDNKVLIHLKPEQIDYVDEKYLTQIKPVFEKSQFITLFDENKQVLKVFMFEDDKLVKVMKKWSVKQLCQWFDLKQFVNYEAVETLKGTKPLIDEYTQLFSPLRHQNSFSFEKLVKISQSLVNELDEKLKERVYVVNQQYVISEVHRPYFSDIDWFLLLHCYCLYLDDVILYANANQLSNLNSYLILKHMLFRNGYFVPFYEVILICKDNLFYKNFSHWSVFETVEKFEKYFTFRHCNLEGLYMVGNVGLKNEWVVLFKYYPSLQLLEKFKIQQAKQLYQLSTTVQSREKRHYQVFKYEGDCWKFAGPTQDNTFYIVDNDLQKIITQ